MDLVPQNILVGQHEDVPGLRDGNFPIPRLRMGVEMNKNRLNLLPKKKLYIHNLKLLSKPELEHRFTKFL